MSINEVIIFLFTQSNMDYSKYRYEKLKKDKENKKKQKNVVIKEWN